MVHASFYLSSKCQYWLTTLFEIVIKVNILILLPTKLYQLHHLPVLQLGVKRLDSIKGLRFTNAAWTAEACKMNSNSFQFESKCCFCCSKWVNRNTRKEERGRAKMGMRKMQKKLLVFARSWRRNGNIDVSGWTSFSRTQL